jgi:5-methylcytosine-specific restriction endonuclease McrA
LHWQDAAKMIYENTVDVIAEYDEELRSPSTVWKMPAVVRLRRNVGDRKRGVKFSRMNVYQRDNFICQYCGKKFRWSELTYDHLVPRSRGGRTNFLNIVTACKPCNAKKANLTCEAPSDLRGLFAQAVSLFTKSSWHVQCVEGDGRLRRAPRTQDRARRTS